MHESIQPSNLEMQILSLLWRQGPLTARAVLEQMPDAKPRAYTTVLTTLQVMEKKGLVSHEADGNRHVYGAVVKQRAVLGPMLKGLVKTIFGGRPASAMQHLLETTEVSPEELARMRQLLDDYQRQQPAPQPPAKRTRKKD